MKVENTENNRKIQQVAATMAIEDMYMSKDCLQGLIDVANGTKQGVMEELKATDMMAGLANLLCRCPDQQQNRIVGCLQFYIRAAAPDDIYLRGKFMDDG